MGENYNKIKSRFIVYKEQGGFFMNNCFQNQCPCKYDPIVMPVKERICNRYYCVEQPVICPINTRVVNHYVPRPVYYHTYTRTEENVCEGNTNMQYNPNTQQFNQ